MLIGASRHPPIFHLSGALLQMRDNGADYALLAR
jgi:hypothetical protein